MKFLNSSLFSCSVILRCYQLLLEAVTGVVAGGIYVAASAHPHPHQRLASRAALSVKLVLLP